MRREVLVGIAWGIVASACGGGESSLLPDSIPLQTRRVVEMRWQMVRVDGAGCSMAARDTNFCFEHRGNEYTYLEDLQDGSLGCADAPAAPALFMDETLGTLAALPISRSRVPTDGAPEIILVDRSLVDDSYEGPTEPTIQTVAIDLPELAGSGSTCDLLVRRVPRGLDITQVELFVSGQGRIHLGPDELNVDSMACVASTSSCMRDAIAGHELAIELERLTGAPAPEFDASSSQGCEFMGLRPHPTDSNRFLAAVRPDMGASCYFTFPNGAGTVDSGLTIGAQALVTYTVNGTADPGYTCGNGNEVLHCGVETPEGADIVFTGSAVQHVNLDGSPGNLVFEPSWHGDCVADASDPWKASMKATRSGYCSFNLIEVAPAMDCGAIGDLGIGLLRGDGTWQRVSDRDLGLTTEELSRGVLGLEGPTYGPRFIVWTIESGSQGTLRVDGGRRLEQPELSCPRGEQCLLQLEFGDRCFGQTLSVPFRTPGIG